jgi:beta-N-acetylhexosaminidase
VSFPGLDELPASLSRWWIETELRGELGFSGAVISDDMHMAGAAAWGTHAERVARALAAGCDLVLLCNCPAQVPEVIASLGDYSDPVAQLRLMRLRGRAGPDLATLRQSDRWRRARDLIDALQKPPTLRLES